MIIIKPDLVIKWANGNLVVHRVREHLCVFLRVFTASPYVFEYSCDCAWEFEYAHASCVTGESAAEGKAYGTFAWAWWLLSSSFWQIKRRSNGKTHTHSLTHSLFSSLFSISHSVQLSPSLFLYHLQRQPFPPKWGHVWNHRSWIRMGHHIP